MRLTSQNPQKIQINHQNILIKHTNKQNKLCAWRDDNPSLF